MPFSEWVAVLSLAVMATAPVDGGVTAELPRCEQKLGPNSSLVRAKDAVPALREDLRYATPKNFLGRAVYTDHASCLLVREAAERLARARAQLHSHGFQLVVLDCFRPRSVQRAMWKLFPKPGYVADPAKGSLHNRGAAVDVTLATLAGEPVEMPTEFDVFTRAAHHGDSSSSARAQRHRELLREAMETAGFRKNRMEWWHYELPRASRFPLLDCLL